MVILSALVGSLTGPRALRSLLLARSMSSRQTFSRDWTLREVRVMRILWYFCRKFELDGFSCYLHSGSLRRRRQRTGASPKSFSGF